MPDMATIGVFLVGAILLNLTPGPDMLYVIARSAGQGRKAGIVSALGIGVGTLVHTTAAAFGLSALLMSSALAYSVAKYVGALYLIYLGVRMILSKRGVESSTQLKQTRLPSVFRQAIITNVLNPKVALFFLAFTPQFVDTSRGAAAWQFVIFGLLFNTTGTIWNLTVAMLAGYADDWLKNRPSFSRAQRWFTGTVFIALGARIALLERK
jgi:threonine/homoserine/homoserine lactone efflux protein